MKRSISFPTLATVSLIAGLLIALSAALAQPVEDSGAQTRPYVDPMVIGDSTLARCTSMFRILDANHDGYITRDEARKSAETTAVWKRLDDDLNDRLSFDEFCAANAPGP
ncbi:MAG: EF-hand domain-containing protein [Betaproteobacteria bacterium]|nr:EF-hand domain-containing protein [Betaproteobacteria bacterium]